MSAIIATIKRNPKNQSQLIVIDTEGNGTFCDPKWIENMHPEMKDIMEKTANGPFSPENTLVLETKTEYAGSTYVAEKDSGRLDANNKPIYFKGDTVTRSKDSTSVTNIVAFATYKASMEAKLLQKQLAS